MTNTETKSRPVRKAAAVIGFVALLVLIAWLSIMIVRNVPGSFASLASLAESVRSFDALQPTPEETGDDSLTLDRDTLLVVTSDTNVIGSGDQVRLSWTDASRRGSFAFSYQCQEGVALSIVETDGVRDISCDTNYNLGDVTDLTVIITSEKERFADVSYQVAFLTTGDTAPRATANAVITLVNEDIPSSFTSTSNENEAAEGGTEETAAITETETTDPTPVTDTPPATTGQAGETFTQEFTYTIPVSDPTGRIDLAVKFIDTGVINNQAFLSRPLESEASGAVQFEVKNLGTKTSETWTYSITLPAGNTLESPAQAPLKPNERALITVGFPIPDIARHDFVINIDTVDDNTSLNDTAVEIVSLD